MHCQHNSSIRLKPKYQRLIFWITRFNLFSFNLCYVIFLKYQTETLSFGGQPSKYTSTEINLSTPLTFIDLVNLNLPYKLLSKKTHQNTKKKKEKML